MPYIRSLLHRTYVHMPCDSHAHTVLTYATHTRCANTHAYKYTHTLRWGRSRCTCDLDPLILHLCLLPPGRPIHLHAPTLLSYMRIWC